MTPSPSPWLFAAVFAATAALTACALAASRRLHIIDIPNARSSHNRPTPKGGGIAMALVISLALLAAGIPSLSVLGVAGFALAILGLIDDIRELRALPRFIAQLLAAAGTLVLPLLAIDAHTGAAGLITLGACALLAMLWLTNLYNFMDGIDGIAALQAMLLGAGIYLLHGLGLYPGELAWIALLIGCAAAGFMLFNFPPARFFMGDAGSAFLGFVFAGTMFIEASAAPGTLWLWLILLAGFVSDATTTLVCRVARGKPFHQAHRTHVYQLATGYREASLRDRGIAPESARRRAHRTYLLCFALVFCFFQLPASLLIARGIVPPLAGVAGVYLVLVVLCLAAGAGRDRFLPYCPVRKKQSR